MKEGVYSNPYRWVVLACFMLLAGINQLLWLNFVPLLGEIQKTYNISEMLATSLTLCFPLLYVFLAMPSGAMVDRRGYRLTLSLGAIIMTLGTIVRIYTGSFWALLVGQVLVAIAQPFILNGITKVAADWFEEHQRALATGLGTAGMFAGMAVGMAVTPALNEAYGLQITMIIFAGITGFISILFILLAKENPEGIQSRQEVQTYTAFSEMMQILRQPALLLVIIIAFLALGYFNGLTTWFEALLSENGVEALDAGIIGGVMILGGIVGSLILPAISDRLEKRKPVLILCGITGLILTFPLFLSSNLTVLYWSGGLLGFFFLPGYALLLAMSEELAGAERAGGAAGALMLAGNAGGVIVATIMGLMHSGESGWRPAEYLLVAILVSIFLLAFWTTESFRMKPAEASAGA
ncbi:MAG: MFS transporter [Spirochaetaceae bacterium]|nr:MFS transporter [Spirochaetaceae bacterium]|tara:strand:+ start:92193 stop:93419 length:1227 start_codon:yes stop_codon:yes gene_type:complete